MYSFVQATCTQTLHLRYLEFYCNTLCTHLCFLFLKYQHAQVLTFLVIRAIVNIHVFLKLVPFYYSWKQSSPYYLYTFGQLFYVTFFFCHFFILLLFSSLKLTFPLYMLQFCRICPYSKGSILPKPNFPYFLLWFCLFFISLAYSW